MMSKRDGGVLAWSLPLATAALGAFVLICSCAAPSGASPRSDEPTDASGRPDAAVRVPGDASAGPLDPSLGAMRGLIAR